MEFQHKKEEFIFFVCNLTAAALVEYRAYET